jgi:hypothetical protein
MMSGELDVKRLVAVPALIALAVTLVRLVGELSGGSQLLFNREAGGPGALIGIVWLIPILGVYFAIRLIGSGHPHSEVGPPGYPEMSLPVKFVAIAVFPQLTFWVMATVGLGLLFGGLTAAVRGRQKAAA